MIDLRGKSIKTKDMNETIALMSIAVMDGFVFGEENINPLNDVYLLKNERYFHFWEDDCVTWGTKEFMSPGEFADFSDISALRCEDEEVFTEQDFRNAVLSVIRDAVDSGNSDRTADIADVFVALERELFGIEQEE